MFLVKSFGISSFGIRISFTSGKGTKNSFGILSERLHNGSAWFVGRKEPHAPMTSTMNNEIAILAQFLESLGPEVSGRSASPLTDDQAERIRLFAAGKLGPSERQALLPGLLENETALHALVKTLREQA